MGWLIEALIGPLGALLGVVAAGVGAWLAGRRSGAHRAEREAERAYRKTRERMDDVQMGDDPDALREWLRLRDRDQP